MPRPSFAPSPAKLRLSLQQAHERHQQAEAELAEARAELNAAIIAVRDGTDLSLRDIGEMIGVTHVAVLKIIERHGGKPAASED